MSRWINKFNHKKYNKKRVRRIMDVLGIKSVIRRKKSKYTKSKAEVTAENILKRDFNTSKPNEKWATDVTEFIIICMKQKLYLSAIIDLYDRSIVSYIISHRNDNNLVFRTFEKAMEANPGAMSLFHSDRGYQYTSSVFKKMLENAEMYYLNQFHTTEELKVSIEKYIEFYNYQRPQGRYCNQTPIEVRTATLTAMK